jgi:hypothetical protein
MRKTRWVVLSALAILAAAAHPAAADDSPPAPKNSADGYMYTFKDDPLQAGGLGPLGASITVSKSAARATLIRPRTAFVVELLKSVEHL